ncbi:MAG TPA: hypothetical protein VIG34_10425 [Xanthobacteraceae bacterium]|jgi:hypothetical protein
MKKLTALIAATALLGSTVLVSAIFTPPTEGISNLQLTQDKDKGKKDKKDKKKKDKKDKKDKK